MSNTGVNGNEISRKSAVFYRDMNGSLKATHLYVKNVNEVYQYYPKSVVEMVIGGNDYNLESWGGSSNKGELGYYLSIPRTILAWKNNDAYLIAGQGSVPFMRDIMDDLDLNAETRLCWTERDQPKCKLVIQKVIQLTVTAISIT